MVEGRQHRQGRQEFGDSELGEHQFPELPRPVIQ